MDYADDDAVRRFELWEEALRQIAWKEPVSEDVSSAAWKLITDETSFARMKREALINAARIPGTEHLPRLQKAYPGVDLAPLVEALRIKVVILRLEGGS